MIAKGNLHADGVKLAAYLTTGKDGERAELHELRGFVAGNIHDAFRDVEIQAEATRCEKPFFHAYVRLPAHEQLTKEQWEIAADRIERMLGFKDQPRAIAFHYKANGETHMHVAWSRIDLDEMRAIDPGLFKNKLKQISRELEKEFGLTVVRNDRDPEQKTRSADRNEFEQSRRLNNDLKETREAIRDCWDRSDNGAAFEAALREKGFTLARGDRRDFVVVDREGGTHALGKRILGVTAPEIRKRLADIDRARLPTVADARAAALARAKERRPERPRQAPAAEPRPAPSHTERPRTAPAARAPSKGSAARGAARLLDGVAKTAGSILDFISNAFAPPADAKPSQDREPQPMPPEAPRQPEAHQREEQQRAERVQSLVNKYGVAPSPEMERDAELRPGRERDRER